jgi:hypothetical protein
MEIAAILKGFQLCPILWPDRSVIHTYWGSSPPNVMFLSHFKQFRSNCLVKRWAKMLDGYVGFKHGINYAYTLTKKVLEAKHQRRHLPVRASVHRIKHQDKKLLFQGG